MTYFINRRPKGFHYVRRFADERQEILRESEKRARRRLEGEREDGQKREHVTYDSFTSLSRRKRERHQTSLFSLLGLILALVLIGMLLLIILLIQ